MAGMTDGDAEARVDRALVARALLEGDRRAFEQLLRRHQGMVRAQLRRLLHGDEAAADDLAQETFLLAWRKLDQFRGEARFSTWLYRIAYSCFLQAVRKRSWPAGTGVCVVKTHFWRTCAISASVAAPSGPPPSWLSSSARVSSAA